MIERPFGQTGLKTSILGLGAAEFGYAGAPAARVKLIIDAALDAGINVIDTAECYGTSEATLGKALEGRRGRVALFSKCGHARGYDKPDWDDIPALTQSLERSLELLRTDRLDLFQLHSCPKEVLERGEVVEFMRDVKKAGKARLIGYSGDGAAALYAVKSGAFDALQISVNVADQEALREILPEATRRGMGVIAKRPIANAAWRYEKKPDNGYHVPYWQRLRRLKYDFLAGPGAAEKALRFTLSVPGVSTAIVGTEKPERIAKNLELAGRGPLAKREFDAVRARWSEIAGPDWVGQI